MQTMPENGEQRLQLWKDQIAAFTFPRWQELPEIDLYMDQVVGYLSQKLDDQQLCQAEDHTAARQKALQPRIGIIPDGAVLCQASAVHRALRSFDRTVPRRGDG